MSEMGYKYKYKKYGKLNYAKFIYEFSCSIYISRNK